jgi:hypothetical protein
VNGVVRGFVPIAASGVISLDPALTVAAMTTPAGDFVQDGIFQLSFGGSAQWFQDIDQKISAGDRIYMTPNSATPTACQLIFEDLLPQLTSSL